MNKLIFVGLLFAAFWYWNKGQLPFGGKHIVAVDATGSSAVWLFNLDGCGSSCASAVKELRSRNVPFQEEVISPQRPDEPDYKLWKSYGAVNSFPFLVAGDQTIVGFRVQDWASLLGKVFGDKYLTPDERRFFQVHFNSDGSPRIVLYGTDWCAHCAKLRKALNANAVGFEDIDVEKHGDKDRLLQTMGIAGYPATWVGYTRVKNGSDCDEIMALLQKSR